MAFENISPGAYFRNFMVPPQPSTNVLRLLEDVTPSFFFSLTGSCVTLAKVKQIKAAALCYEVVLRCQQVII